MASWLAPSAADPVSGSTGVPRQWWAPQGNGSRVGRPYWMANRSPEDEDVVLVQADAAAFADGGDMDPVAWGVPLCEPAVGNSHLDACLRSASGEGPWLGDGSQVCP
jgi:hypothetical protein